MDEIIYSPLFLIILLVILVLVINAFLQIRWRVVPQEERLVIYRLGHFNRIAGPGPVMLFQRFETVERTLRVLDQPANYTVQGLFMQGIPFGYTLNIWRGFDLQSTAGKDHDALAKMAMFDDKMREQMIQAKLREALVQSASEVKAKKEIVPSTPIFERLLPVLPGLPDSQEFLKAVEEKLAQTLPSIGVVLNRSQPITVMQLHLGQDLRDSFEVTRMTQVLRQQYPDLSEDAMIQVIASIKGVDPLNVERISVADRETQQVRSEIRVGQEGMKTKTRIMTQRPEEKAKPDAVTTPGHPGQPVTQDDGHLNKYDLSLLKQVPQRPAA